MINESGLSRQWNLKFWMIVGILVIGGILLCPFDSCRAGEQSKGVFTDEIFGIRLGEKYSDMKARVEAKGILGQEQQILAQKGNPAPEGKPGEPVITSLKLNKSPGGQDYIQQMSVLSFDDAVYQITVALKPGDDLRIEIAKGLERKYPNAKTADNLFTMDWMTFLQREGDKFITEIDGMQMAISMVTQPGENGPYGVLIYTLIERFNQLVVAATKYEEVQRKAAEKSADERLGL